ncbi:MAG: hypothetical protein ACI88H_000750 [Cocleimonas sp.]|jgi:hypothetical protein
MSDYPGLTEMGINGFDEIKKYSVQQDQKDRDTLRISYKRKKGSMLPKRKTFRFGRSAKMINDSSAPNGTIEIFEISPFLQKVMLELDKLVGSNHEEKDKVEALLEHINQLEREMMFTAGEMRALLKDIK